MIFCVYLDIRGFKMLKLLSVEKNRGNHAVQFYSGPLWPPKHLLFFLRVWMPRLLGDFRGIPAGLSLRLFVLGTRSVWVLFLFLFPRPECWWRPASQVAHTSKQEGSRLLVFRQTSLTFFVVWGTGGARRFISRGSPPHPLSPSTSPLPHPTGAAKSKCQSRRRRCIPSKGQLVVATEGSVARLSQNTGQLFKNLLFNIVQSGYRFISSLQNKTAAARFSSSIWNPSLRWSLCFEESGSALCTYLPHTGRFSLLRVIWHGAWFTMYHICNLLLS